MKKLLMSDAEVDGVYGSAVAETVKRKLKLRLPALRSPDGEFTVGGLMIVFFASRVGRVATKAELAEFLRAMKCETLDPQPRHLGMQLGLNFLVQGCYHPRARRPLRRGEYCLLDLKHAHPSHSSMHRAKAELTWAPIKALYGGRCACCGSVEGEQHLKNAHLVTTLEKGHCDPRKPLSSDNCIPMCKLCNMVYKDHAVLNRRGFVVRWLKHDDDRPPPGADEEQEVALSKKRKKKATTPKKAPKPLSSASSETATSASPATTADDACSFSNSKPPLVPDANTWAAWAARRLLGAVSALMSFFDIIAASDDDGYGEIY